MNIKMHRKLLTAEPKTYVACVQRTWPSLDQDRDTLSFNVPASSRDGQFKVIHFLEKPELFPE